MGTVLSFSPRERRPVYSTYNSNGTLNSAGSAEYPLNNYSYEHLNNVKNRENSKSSLCQVPNNSNLSQTHNNHHHHTHLHNGSSNNNNKNNINNSNTINNNNISNNTNSNNDNHNININNNTNNNHVSHVNSSDRNDTARILSEKNALEKNLKLVVLHSLLSFQSMYNFWLIAQSHDIHTKYLTLLDTSSVVIYISLKYNLSNVSKKKSTQKTLAVH